MLDLPILFPLGGCFDLYIIIGIAANVFCIQNKNCHGIKSYVFFSIFNIFLSVVRTYAEFQG